jgi:predicted nucleic acid-binding protein
VTLHYLDASAWVKRYYQERGTAWVQDLFVQNSTMVCASLGLIEVMATLARKGKAQEINSSVLNQKVQELEEDWQRFIQVQLTTEAVDIAKELARDLALRGADAVHLASGSLLQRRFAEEDDRLILVTSDHELKEAAQSSGLAVMDPDEQERQNSDLSEKAEQEKQEEE